tara:strand:- start:3883 stop:4605 length:723 start_codon:yes stop_codon:yes gene_type:complete
MANFKKDYKDTEVRTTHRTKVPRVTLTKVEPADDDKRTRAELLDAIEDLFQNTFRSGRKQSYDKEIDLESLRSILTMLVLSVTNNSDDSVGATQQQIDAINTNTSKTGITADQIRDIQANNAKNSITTSQSNAITANTSKTTFPGFGTSSGKALEGDTSLLQLGTSSSTALAGNTTTISTSQANAITANTAKVSQGLNTANMTMSFDVSVKRGAYTLIINVLDMSGGGKGVLKRAQITLS